MIVRTIGKKVALSVPAIRRLREAAHASRGELFALQVTTDALRIEYDTMRQQLVERDALSQDLQNELDRVAAMLETAWAAGAQLETEKQETADDLETALAVASRTEQEKQQLAQEHQACCDRLSKLENETERRRQLEKQVYILRSDYRRSLSHNEELSARLTKAEELIRTLESKRTATTVGSMDRVSS